MEYNLEKSIQILDRTPAVLKTLLSDLDEDWTKSNEGPDTFSPYDVIGHLIHGEKTDWPGRIKMILERGTSATFIPYDRFAMYKESEGKSLADLLNAFELIRGENMRWFRSLNLTESDLGKKGIHPKFGEVTLRQLLATWVIHDLTHMAQITRVMAKQYKTAMGPWVEYFRIMSF